MKKTSRLGASIVGAALIFSWGKTSAFGLTVKLPDEKARLLPGPNLATATTYCYTCHSVDYILTQPRGMPSAFWQSAVLKMKNAYGAPIPEDKVAPLVEYLFKTYAK